MRARDSAGNLDQSPARRDFTVIGPVEGQVPVTPYVPPVTAPVPPADVEAPAVKLGGKKTQKAGKTISVVVKAMRP